MNFVNPWKLNPIKDWAHFNRFMTLVKFLEMKWPIKVYYLTQEYLEKGPLIDWALFKIDENLKVLTQWEESNDGRDY